MGIPICGACRRPIEERIVTALGKHWHVEVLIKITRIHPFFLLMKLIVKCLSSQMRSKLTNIICLCFSTLYVPNVRSHSMVIAITRRRALPTASSITINCLETCAMCATKSLLVMVSTYITSC